MLLALALACPTENIAPLAPGPGGGSPPPTATSATADATTPTSAAAPGTVRVAASDTLREIVDPAAKSLAGQGITVSAVDAAGGGDAIKSLRAGNADIAFLGRALRDAETDLVATPVGYDAAVIIVATSNTVSSLRADEVSGLFGGTISNWNLVGDMDAPVHVYVGPPERGPTRLLNDHYQLDGTLPSNGKVMDPARELIAAVAADGRGIGVVSLGALRARGVVAVSRVKIDGIGPEAPAVQTQEYPLVLPMNVVTIGPPTGEAKTFVDYLLGADGQALVGAAYVPVR